MSAREPIYLIVNADDYGYFPCISRGILEAASHGAVTSTGILANGPDLELQIEWLKPHQNLDLGVHLNLTCRRPLTSLMAHKLGLWEECFPGAYVMAGLLLAGRVAIETIRAEWRTQIEVCLRQGLSLSFLNSHEHIHMLPILFPLTLELAQEYKIPHVRLTQAEWLPPIGISSLIRNTLIQTFDYLNRGRINTFTPIFLGLSRSGKLGQDYFNRIISKLKPGFVYELMCHPGHFDAAEISDPHLRSYHAWESELELLNSAALQSFFGEFGIQVINYKSLRDISRNRPPITKIPV